MKVSFKLPLLVAAVVLVLAASTAVQSAPSSGQPQSIVAKSLQRVKSMPKLFNYEQYRKLFNKSYSSVLELMVRAKYFMSRSIRAFISAFKYSHREQSYFLSINFMSDYVQSELDEMRNKALDREENVAESNTVHDSESSTLEFLPGQDGEQTYQTLVKSLETRKADPFYAELLETLKLLEQPGGDRSKVQGMMSEFLRANEGTPVHAAIAGELDKFERSRRLRRNVIDGTKQEQAKSRRELPLDRLINLGTSERLSPEAEMKIPARPKSNNPNYEAPELLTMGMVDQQVPLEIRRLKSGQASRSASSGKNHTNTNTNSHNIVINIKDIDAFLDNLKNQPEATIDKLVGTSATKESVNMPDEVFSDLRDSNCLFLPRNQGKCGSCYAFATTSMMEYLHCKKTGQLVAFSEQYIIDCGKQYHKDIFGCSGGRTQDMPEYFHNFGLELRSLYPYRMMEDQCPYDQDYNLLHAGFIRTDVKLTLVVPVARFVDVLKFAPILLSVTLSNDFKEYGGGVHPNTCDEEGEHHAMLLVGHGREDNHEYWLIRNSYSVGWGEGGYYKMSKDTNCIDNDFGWIFGSSDGKNLDLIVEANKHHNEDLIQEHYFKSITI